MTGTAGVSDPTAAQARYTREAALTVDLDAVATNTRLFSLTSGAVMAVVKGDGYGLGAAAVARTALASGAVSLAVSSVSEGLTLRRAGLSAPVLSMLNPVGTDFGPALRAGIELAVPSMAHLRAAERAAERDETRARVHLFLDVSRDGDGADRAERPRLCRAAWRAQLRGTIRVIGVMGHLACADVPADPCNETGRAMFSWGVMIAHKAGLRPGVRHLAATAAAITDPRNHHSVCRVGSGLAGIDPSRTASLRQPLTLTAPIVTVRHVSARELAGSGHTWTAQTTANLGVLPVGYTSGLPRAASGWAHVMIRGRRCRVAGLISANQTVIDLGDTPGRPGDIATIFGPGEDGEPTLSDWATWAGTVEQEITSSVGAQVRRHFTGANRVAAGSPGRAA